MLNPCSHAAVFSHGFDFSLRHTRRPCVPTSDTVTASYSWTVDGVAVTNTTDTIPTADIADNEVWECTITPNDGTIDGTPISVAVTVGGNVEGATGGSFCASAGENSDSNGNTTHSCLAEAGVAGTPASDNANNEWQPGSIFVFSPE